VAAAADWLEQHGPDLEAALAPLMNGLLTDGMAIGVLSAQAVTPGTQVAKAARPGGLNPAAKWKPGDSLMSGGILGGAGVKGPTAAQAGEAAGRLAAGARTAAGRALVEGESADEAGEKVFAAVTDKVKAAAAVMNEITSGSARAAGHWYLKVSVQWVEWLTEADAKVCPLCQANADQGPVRLGESFSSGDDSPPGHKNCRCALLPAGWQAPPPQLQPPAGEPGLEAGDEEDGDEEAPAVPAPEPEAPAEPEAAPEGPPAVAETPVAQEFTEYEAQQWIRANTPKLTRQQGRAVRNYTEYSFGVNGALRAGAEPSPASAKMMQGLDSAMEPLPSSVVLRRIVGENAFPGGIPSAGEVIADEGYSSTSLGPDIGGGDVRMEIVTPAGTPALVTGRYSVMPDQREVILARGTRLRVVSAEQQAGGRWDLVLEVVQGAPVAKSAAPEPGPGLPPGGDGESTLADRMADAVYTVVSG